jgi:hypothetical protein
MDEVWKLMGWICDMTMDKQHGWRIYEKGLEKEKINDALDVVVGVV